MLENLYSNKPNFSELLMKPTNQEHKAVNSNSNTPAEDKKIDSNNQSEKDTKSTQDQISVEPNTKSNRNNTTKSTENRCFLLLWDF